MTWAARLLLQVAEEPSVARLPPEAQALWAGHLLLVRSQVVDSWVATRSAAGLLVGHPAQVALLAWAIHPWAQLVPQVQPPSLPPLWPSPRPRLYSHPPRAANPSGE